MRVVRHLQEGNRPFSAPVVALGNFDGLHLGHRKILSTAIERAAALGGDPLAFTFMPHPASVIAPDRAPPLLTSLAERLSRLREAGLAGVVVQRFTPAFASHGPREFVQRFLVDGLGVSGVVVGYNVTFGRDRAGTPEVLQKLGSEMGFEVVVVSPSKSGDRAVSSTLVRRAVAAGEVEVAAKLLGRPHEVSGRVRLGEQRGATIGFPTANLLPRAGMLPPDGVYAVRARIEGESVWRDGVANLGTNPTFGGRQRRLEAHLFDYDGDLYGAVLRVGLVQRLRGEIKFSSVEDLVTRIRADAQSARQILAATS